jgi:hypothetical protein
MKSIINFILSILITSFFSINYAQEDLEQQCAKLLLKNMKEQNLIGNGSDGICIQDLDSLPKVTIGLGSSVYKIGSADGNSLGDNASKVKQLSKILTGKEMQENEFSIVGYADGLNNTIDAYRNSIFGDKDHFTKKDLVDKITDSNTRSKILELLSDTAEDSQFKKNHNHKNFERVLSLIGNYYLAVDRAKETCEQLTSNPTNSCNDKISGLASPESEVKFHGENACGLRRRSVLMFGASSKSSQQSTPSEINPSFMTPPTNTILDMQIAASLDLMKRIKGNDPTTVIEKIAAECSGNNTNSTAFQYNRQNLKRMYDDINQQLDKSTNPKLKDAILKGDFLTSKSELEKLNENDPDYQLKETVINGMNKKAAFERLTVKPNGASAKPLNCERNTPEKDSRFSENYLECKNPTYPHRPLYFSLPVSETSEIQELEINDSGKTERKKFTNFVSIDPTYPMASRGPTSTDPFNCLSVSQAIENQLKNSTPDGSSGEFIEPSTLIAKDDGKINARIKSLKEISLKSKPEKTAKGWVCEACHNGLKQEINANGGPELKYTSREMVQRDAASEAYKALPLEDSGLTFGSMKKLGLRKITRDHFGESCPKTKTVCQCLKDENIISGKLDRIIKEADVINLDKFNLNLNFQPSDKDNTCFWAPPVSPTCTVAPNGKNHEDTKRGLASESCQALERFFVSYPYKRPTTDLTDYLKTQTTRPVDELVCKNIFPAENDLKDCYKRSTTQSESSKGSLH